MSDDRPRIAPQILAALLEAAPGRVRKRLDREPAAATEWSWERTGGDWIVAAGEERVTLVTENDVVLLREGASCTCLLSPNCFHVLACVSLLKVDAGESAGLERIPDGAHGATPATEAESAEPPEESTVEVTAAMREAAGRVRDAARDLLAVGARGAGTLVQSGLLRAGHQCRSVELPALGNAMLRVADGVRSIRLQEDDADADALRQDLFAALEGAVRLSSHPRVDISVVGTSRREYRPTNVNRLEGWFAEPVLTRSGYAGVCVRLLAPTGDRYQVLDLRPGDSQLVLQAYAGGIDLGTAVASGRDLCRKVALVQKLGASSDGRLGRGTSTRWVLQRASNFEGGAAAELFATPLARQIESVFAQAASPADRRAGGWDCVAFEGRALGADGASVLFDVAGSPQPWRLRIAIDRPELPFRENLQLIARCPGLRLRCVGRLRLESAGDVDLLAVGPLPNDDESEDAGAPELRLPEEWGGKCNVGLDRLQARHVTGMERRVAEVGLEKEGAARAAEDGLAPVARRLGALALGGWRAIPNLESTAHRRDAASLESAGQGAAAVLLRRLGESAASLAMNRPNAGTQRGALGYSLAESSLACSLYLTAARLAFHRERWLERTVDR